ncbi:MAG: hypothetical protein ABW223_05570, partial [Rariglobus sp.]
MLFKVASLLFVLCLLGPVQAATVKSTVSLSSNGVVIDNGVDAPLTLSYPLVSNETRKESKVDNATVTGSTAVVNYEGGGKLKVEVAAGSVTFDLTGLPAGTKHLHAVLNIGPEYTGVGKWQVGTSPLTLFPQAKPASPFLHKGGATEFSLFGPTGVSTTVRVPEFCYQQVNDNREWNADLFQWHVWLPITAEATTLTLQIEISAADSASGAVTPASQPPASRAVAPATTVSPETKPTLKTIAPSDEPITGTRILKWKDGKRAPFMIEFDDSATTHIT